MTAKKRKYFFAKFGALALFLGTALPAGAQNDYQNFVRSLLDQTESQVRDRGYSPTHSRQYGQLRVGEEQTVTVDLNSGTSYMMIGQCDQDCSDIDLWIYDENGNLVDEDVLVDDTPIVEVTPIRGARFSMRVRMVTCRAEPCYYGIGVFGQ